MHKYKNILIIFVTFNIAITKLTYQQVVCSLDELTQELYEDLSYNNKLNCLTKFSDDDIIQFEKETQDNKDKMIRSLWTGDCAFEAYTLNINNNNNQSNINNNRISTWEEKLKQNYDLKKGLVDVNGDSVDNNIMYQADMCEIIRSLIANGKITGVSDNISYIPLSAIDYIGCPGGDFQSNICAVNSGSYAENYNWYIPLDGQSIRINDYPIYETSKLINQK